VDNEWNLSCTKNCNKMIWCQLHPAQRTSTLGLIVVFLPIQAIRPWPSPPIPIPITYLLITISSHTIQSELLTVQLNKPYIFKQLQMYPGKHRWGGRASVFLFNFWLHKCAIK
jgi:hypothetical protein